MIMGRFTVFVFALSIIFTNYSHAQEELSRKEKKAVCKQVQEQCLADGNQKKVCRKEKRACRKELGVRFIDDVVHVYNVVKGKAIEVSEKIAANVKVKRVEIGEEEVFLVNIKAEKLVNVPDTQVQLPPYKSSGGISVIDGQKEVHLQIYSSDFLKEDLFDKVQTSEGRSFPIALGGEVYESLSGKDFGKMQVYLDQDEQVFGAFVPVKEVGDGIKAINDKKNSIEYVKDIVPDINSIPLPVKLNKHKVGRVYALSHDDSGERGGVLLLVSKSELAYAAQLE
jgi:hypothetical protein